MKQNCACLLLSARALQKHDGDEGQRGGPLEEEGPSWLPKNFVSLAAGAGCIHCRHAFSRSQGERYTIVSRSSAGTKAVLILTFAFAFFCHAYAVWQIRLGLLEALLGVTPADSLLQIL